jgi:hypothetical protein
VSGSVSRRPQRLDSGMSTGMPASAFGYTTTPAVHREVKAALVNRDTREQARTHGGTVVGPRNPLRAEPTGAGYLPGHARFDKDGSRQMAVADAQRHEAQKKKVQHLQQSRTQREQQRWQKMDSLHQQETQLAAKLAGTGMRNRGSVGYNLINGSWGSTSAAAKAKYHDDVVEYSAKMRTDNLDRRGNTTFNVITGADRNVVRVPPKPALPPIAGATE